MNFNPTPTYTAINNQNTVTTTNFDSYSDLEKASFNFSGDVNHNRTILTSMKEVLKSESSGKGKVFLRIVQLMSDPQTSYPIKIALIDIQNKFLNFSAIEQEIERLAQDNPSLIVAIFIAHGGDEDRFPRYVDNLIPIVKNTLKNFSSETEDKVKTTVQNIYERFIQEKLHDSLGFFDRLNLPTENDDILTWCETQAAKEPRLFAKLSPPPVAPCVGTLFDKLETIKGQDPINDENVWLRNKMQEYLQNKPMPTTKDDLKKLLADTFYYFAEVRITDLRATVSKTLLMPYTSSSIDISISPSYWENKVIPELIEKYQNLNQENKQSVDKETCIIA